MDMRKEFPSQTKNRRQWIIDTVRENQVCASNILFYAAVEQWDQAREDLSMLHKHDRDALLIPNGILTDEQIEILGHE